MTLRTTAVVVLLLAQLLALLLDRVVAGGVPSRPRDTGP